MPWEDQLDHGGREKIGRDKGQWRRYLVEKCAKGNDGTKTVGE